MEQHGKIIKNLEDELSRIKEEIEKRKKEIIDDNPSNEEKEKIILNALKSHIKENPPENLADNYRISPEQTKKHITDLEPEEDDRKIEELFNLSLVKGVVNTIHICEELKNPHILDDLHRRLAHYFNFEIKDLVLNKNFEPKKASNAVIIGSVVIIVFIFMFVILMII